MSDANRALRQQIAEALHAGGYECLYDDVTGPCEGPNDHLTAADVVLNLLDLTEETLVTPVFGSTDKTRSRWVTPWRVVADSETAT